MKKASDFYPPGMVWDAPPKTPAELEEIERVLQGRFSVSEPLPTPGVGRVIWGPDIPIFPPCPGIKFERNTRVQINTGAIVPKESAVELSDAEKNVISNFSHVDAENFAAKKAKKVSPSIRNDTSPYPDRGDDPEDKGDLIQRAKNHIEVAGTDGDEMSEDQRLDAAAACLTKAAAKARGDKVHAVLSVAGRPMLRFA